MCHSVYLSLCVYVHVHVYCVSYIHIIIHVYMYVLLQAIVSELTDCWKDLIIAERSVLVNVLHRPEALFTRATKAFKRTSTRFLKR